VHFVTPTDDNRRQAEGMKAHGIFNTANMEIGEIIVADVNRARVKELAGSDTTALDALIGMTPDRPAG
jgi:isocitrate lyase